MTLALLTWPITVASLLASWLIGQKHHSGWLITIVTGVAVSLYDGRTSQWGFLAGALVGEAIAIRNYLLWHPDLPSVSEMARLRRSP